MIVNLKALEDFRKAIPVMQQIAESAGCGRVVPDAGFFMGGVEERSRWRERIARLLCRRSTPVLRARPPTGR